MISSNANSSGSDPAPSNGRLTIVRVTPEPEYPKEGETVGFNVKIGSTYPSTERALVKLYVDGELKDSKEVNVSTSGASMTLRWLVQAGEHSYVLKLYNLIGGQKFEEDKNNTLGINVVGASQQFAVSLEAFPTEFEGGGTVWFTVHVKNFVNAAISLSGFVENGVVIKRIDGLEGRIPANGEKNITFSYKVYSVGEHTFKLFLDNYDGKPNGYGAENWSKTTVEVKPVNERELKQVGSECEDIHFDFKDSAYRASLSCQVYLYNPSSSKMSVKDIAVEDNYSLGQLEDFTLALGPLDVPHGSLNVGKWTITPEEFDIDSQETKNITFSLPLEISSYVPISGSDATEVVGKDGSYTEVMFTYTLGYSIGDGKWYHYSNTVRDYVKITMDAKTIEADYILSGGMAFIDPNTAITFSVGSTRISGIRLSLKLSFDPWTFLWNGWIKPYILEHT